MTRKEWRPGFGFRYQLGYFVDCVYSYIITSIFFRFKGGTQVNMRLRGFSASCWRVSFPIPPPAFFFFFFRARVDFRVRGHEYSIVTVHSILQMNNRDIPHPFLTHLLASINCYLGLAPSMFQQPSLVRPEDNFLHFHLVKQFISLFCQRQRHDLICHEANAPRRGDLSEQDNFWGVTNNGNVKLTLGDDVSSSATLVPREILL